MKLKYFGPFEASTGIAGTIQTQSRGNREGMSA
jgi:hypothetical protein